MTFALFPSFFENPEHISFDEQEDDEEIVVFLRQHWIVNVGWIVTSLLLFLLPVSIVFSQRYAIFNLPLTLPIPIYQGLLLVWYLIILAYILENFLSWYFNIYIVTNKHLVDINFRSILARQITQSQISDVQGVKTKLKGIFSSLFNYGDIEVETAAKDQTIDFVNIPHPDIVADRIQDMQSGDKVAG